MTIDTDAEREKLDALVGRPPQRFAPYSDHPSGDGWMEPHPHGGWVKCDVMAMQTDLSATLHAALDEIDRLRSENDKPRSDMSGGSFYQEKDIDAMQDEIDRLRAICRDVPSALSAAFSAGAEESYGGSARRQAKLLECVEDLRGRVAAEAALVRKETP